MGQRAPVAEIGAEDYRIVRHTHDLELATELMQSKLNSECSPMDLKDFGPPHVGRPRRVWCRIVPALPNSHAAGEGWAYSYSIDAKPGTPGVFPAVEFLS